eukprot:scaffold1280_cov379-Prasinococcus_capsulatus_cf.AAC.7
MFANTDAVAWVASRAPARAPARGRGCPRGRERWQCRARATAPRAVGERGEGQRASERCTAVEGERARQPNGVRAHHIASRRVASRRIAAAPRAWAKAGGRAAAAASGSDCGAAWRARACRLQRPPDRLGAERSAGLVARAGGSEWLERRKWVPGAAA